MMSRILVAVALLCAMMAQGHAQSAFTKAQLNAQIGVNFPDNTSGLILPSNARTISANIVNSIMPTAPVVSGNLACFNGTTGQLQDCGVAPSPVPPKIQRYGALSTTFTTDATATLVEIWLQGAGGGGSGNNNTNAIPYTQYGFIGTPSAFGADLFTVTINNTGGASAATISSGGPAYNANCNQPFFLTTTGTLPSPFTPNTIYYTGCSPDMTITFTTIQASTTQFAAPLTCAVSAPRCQLTNAIKTTTAGSGVHTLNLYHYIAQGGSGGGIIGDQAVPGAYANCDSNGPAGYVQSVGLQGAVGQNQYGMNVTGGAGGSGPFGGAGGGGAAGSNETGGGGGGANPTLTSSTGGGGASGGWCYIALRNTGATAYPMTCGTGGAAGPAQAATVTVTIASPAVFTLAAHGMGPNASFTLVNNGDTLPTGLAFATTYYVNPETITANTFEIAASPYGAVITTTGSQSGTHILTSGTAGAAGGHGQCLTKQSYGAN